MQLLDYFFQLEYVYQNYVKVADINFNEKTLKIFGKGSKERILYIGNETVVDFCKKYKQLNEYVAENDYFF